MNPPPPPPPPRPPSAPSAASHDSFGTIQRRAGWNEPPSMTTTAASTAATPAQSYYYGGANSGYASYMGHAPPVHQTAPSLTAASTSSVPLGYSHPASSQIPPAPTKAIHYTHSRLTLPWILIPLGLLLWSSNSLLLQVFLFVTLVLYALDLANTKEATWRALWVGWAVVSMTNAWLIRTSATTPVASLRVAVDTLLLLCLACWCLLQFQWLVCDAASLAARAARALHFLVVPVAASIVTDAYMVASHEWGRVDRAATEAPLVWALLLAVGMYFVGSAAYLPKLTGHGMTGSNSTNGGESDEKRRYLLKAKDMRLHSTLLLFLPPIFHLVMFRRRIVSLYASFDEWYDIILVCAVPYLLHYGLHVLQPQGPYALSWLFSAVDSSTLRGAFVPIAVSVVASLSVQQAYLIPACQGISYQFNGHNVYSGVLISLYLTLATVMALTAAWVWGRKSSRTGQPLFGEFHEDVVQLSLAGTGLCLGKAVGMPWNMTPLPILSFLGLSVWISTRMLRYLAIFLFVVHSTGLVVFSYRFAGIHSTVTMSIPGLDMGLIRFGMVTVGSSCLVGLVAGLAVRSGGGVGSASLKKFDVAGILLILYAVLLCVLEATLLKSPIPFRELMGIESHDSDEGEEEMVYEPLTALMTSAVLGGIAWFMKKYRIMSRKCTIAVWSICVGEAIAVFVDMNEIVLDPAATVHEGATVVLVRSLAASLVIFVMLAPRALLDPVHMKTGAARFKRALGPSGKPESTSAPSAEWVILVYSIIVLPTALVASIPLVLKPLVSVLAGHYSGAYSVSPPATSELVGFALALWGVSSLSMVNHFLPDGGGEAWKRIAALSFLMGIGIAVSAPGLPSDVKTSIHAANPYTSISSAGSLLVTNNRSRLGGWGLVSASLATLLAIAGPLELRERRDGSRQKDTLVLFRLMVFSLMFGCGVSWFVTLECMSEEGFLAIFVTATACMAMSFFGTVVCVLGYFLELKNFDEAEQVAKVWAGAFPVFGLLAGTTQFVKGAAHPFGMGGWLSTYFTMCSFITFAISVVMKCRSTKNAMTRGLGNLSCVVSYLCSVVVCYGRYGVAGLDVSFEMVSVFGISASVLGTFLTSLVLLTLEGEIAVPKRGKIQRLVGPGRGPASSFGFNFSTLGPSNVLAPPVSAAVAVLLGASAYTIFFRGCGFLVTPTSARDVFAGVDSNGRLEEMAAAEELVNIVQKNIMQSQAIATSARLAGSSFWTAASILGPLVHLVGLVATLPSLVLLVTNLWAGEGVSSSKILLRAPLNVVPLILCQGIPTLQAAALVGLVGSAVQVVRLQQNDRQSKLRI